MNAKAPGSSIKDEEAKEQEGVPVKADIESTLKNLSMEELKVKADELNVTYTEDMSFNRLLNRVKKAMADGGSKELEK